MTAVGGDHHAPGRHLVAHLLGGEVGLALGDAPHLGRDGAEPRVLELRDGHEAFRRVPALTVEMPVRGHEIPSALGRRFGHPRRVG